jgi:HTH-type transcriptional regulator, transcriptional repressor of NAD biosynthesis genes
MKSGLILGKFLPPHRGHEYLVNFAASFVDDLTVHVCPSANDPIPGELRFRWMRETFHGRDGIRIVYNDDPNPQTPEDDPEHFWQIWRESLLRHTGHEVEYVFASEEYGWRLGETLDAVYIPVDPAREVWPTSGTAVRGGVLCEWENLLPAARPHFALRVALVGPECSGKSTLAKRLADAFNTTHAPEYARTYIEALPPDRLARLYGPDGTFDAETMRYFIVGQAASVEAQARQCNRVVFSDTEAIVTAAWCEHFLGVVPDFVTEQIGRQRFDLYLLCSATEGWLQDGQRVHPDHASRVRFEERCRWHLGRRDYPYVRLTGDEDERFGQARIAVNALRDGSDERAASLDRCGVVGEPGTEPIPACASPNLRYTLVEPGRKPGEG